MLICVEVLQKFEIMCANNGHTNSAYLKYIIFELGKYFSNKCVVKENCVLCCVMKEPHKLKVGQYTAFMTEINEYMDIFQDPTKVARSGIQNWIKFYFIPL